MNDKSIEHETQAIDTKQVEFHSNLEKWLGPTEGKHDVLKFIENMRIQGSHVCIELLDEHGNELEYAISINYLAKKHGEFIKYSHPEDAAECKAEILKALRDAIAEIELQHSIK